MAWMLLRALQDDVPEDELCGAAACRAMLADKDYHGLLMRGYGSIPQMQAGDTVWWHPDVLHGVEDVQLVLQVQLLLVVPVVVEEAQEDDDG